MDKKYATESLSQHYFWFQLKFMYHKNWNLIGKVKKSKFYHHDLQQSNKSSYNTVIFLEPETVWYKAFLYYIHFQQSAITLTKSSMIIKNSPSFLSLYRAKLWKIAGRLFHSVELSDQGPVHSLFPHGLRSRIKKNFSNNKD